MIKIFVQKEIDARVLEIINFNIVTLRVGDKNDKKDYFTYVRVIIGSCT